MKRIIYISNSLRKDGDSFDHECYWDKDKAIDNARYHLSYLTSSEKKKTIVSVSGYEIETEAETPQEAYEELRDLLFLPDPIFYEVIE